MSDKYPSTLLVSLADKLAKITDEAVRRDIETEIRKADLDLLAKINEIAAGVQNVTQTFTVPGWGTFNFGKWYPYPAGQPVFTGFGTPTNVSFAWKREGGSLKIKGKFTAGTTTAVEARISLPLSLTSDAALVPSIMECGDYIYNGTGNTIFFVLIESGVGYVTLGMQSSTTSALTKINGNTHAAGQILSVDKVEIPVSGWN